MTLHCQRCSWAWTPRPNAQVHGTKPVRCPNCSINLDRYPPKETK